MSKYNKYIKQKHNWQDLNCFTLISQIYQEQLGISLDKHWCLFKDEILKSTTTYFRLLEYTNLKNYIEQFAIEIPLQNLKEYDILVFKSGKYISRNVSHFGMFIGGSHFIHVHINETVSISLLDEEYRKNLLGCFRVV